MIVIFVDLEGIARLPVISAAVAARLAGNWTSIFMFRRCLTSILDKIYAYGLEASGEETEVYEQPRKLADELVLAAVLAPLAATDITTKVLPKIYASDASMTKGAVVSRFVTAKVASTLWLGGDKKGTYTKLDHHYGHLCRAIGIEQDADDIPDHDFPPPPEKIGRAPDFYFDFIEVCAGCGSVSKALASRGLTACRPIEISDSLFFDVTKTELLNWICNMIKSRRIRSIMVEPVCTTFSAAAHPSCRSYSLPEGYSRTDPKTMQGNCIAFRCLFLLWYAAIHECPALGEQPRLSKMAWLHLWRFLVEKKGFQEAIVASCQFGSPHRKEFRLLGRNIDMRALEVRCPGGHQHLRIEGKYTKASAVYVPELALHFAKAFETYRG